MMRAKLVRAKQTVVVRHPDGGMFVPVDPGTAYKSSDPLVRAYPWLFEADSQREERVEQATAAPGERRRR